MAQYSSLMNVMMLAIRKASRGVSRDFGEIENLQVSQKGTVDFVSSTDLRVEQVLKEELLKARPKFGILSEESEEIIGEDKSQRWIIDPIDGTHNLIHGIPHFSISLALEQTQPDGNKEILAGIIYSPMSRETFWAEKGAGAWLEAGDANKSGRLRVAKRKDLIESMFAAGSFKRDMKEIELLTPNLQGIRCFGSTALAMAYVAAGRIDGFFLRNAKIWDIAAGLLIAKEAGGNISNYKGKGIVDDYSELLVTNQIINLKTTKLLGKV